jgi:hypothetical protein
MLLHAQRRLGAASAVEGDHFATSQDVNYGATMPNLMPVEAVSLSDNKAFRKKAGCLCRGIYHDVGNFLSNLLKTPLFTRSAWRP